MKKIFAIILLSVVSIANAQGYICAVGGGSEDYKSWSDKPYSWIVQKADSGKIIIITDTPASDTAWLPNYFRSLGAKTVISKNIGTKTIADDQSTYDELVTAKGIFIRGGDQWQYWHLWSGTKTAQAIKKVFHNGGVIAGTSAGAMSLSEFVYTGTEENTVDSKDVLLNPAHPVIQLQENFLGLVQNSIIDTHFIERGRFGRLIIFMYNLFNMNHKSVLGIGIDDRTALCINPNGIATVYGCGSVSFFQADERTRIVTDGKNYTVENLKCDQLVEDWQYDITKRSVHYIPASAKRVVANRATELPLTDLWFTGNEDIPKITSKALTEFIAKYKPASVTIVCCKGYETIAAALENYLTSVNMSYKTLMLNSFNLNELTTAEQVNSANAFVFCGNNLSTLALLRDNNTISGLAFWKKINSSIPIFAVGNSGKSLCGNYIDNLDKKDDASYRGRMTNNVGVGIFNDLIIQPFWFNNSSYLENRTSALLYGLMRNRKRIGLYLDGSDFATVSVAANNLIANGSWPILIVDAADVDYADSSKWVVDEGVSARQIVAMTNLRYSISSFEKMYSFNSRSLSSITDVKEKIEQRKSFRLENNYPNPFNGSTKICFNLERTSFVSLKVYDITGREVEKIVSQVLTAGEHVFDFIPPQKTATGIYFYRLINEVYSQTKKMVYLR